MSPSRTRIRTLSITSLAAASAIALAACAPATTGSTTSTAATSAAIADSALWDTAEVHSISIDYDQDAYDAMIQAYVDSDAKEWIEATVTIDGVTYENLGLKLKGNSSLRSLSTDADAELSSENPEDLPWIIRLDKFARLA